MEKRIERTAYHEAGHAVASYHYRIGFTSINIIPEEDSSGHVKHPERIYKNFHPEWDDSLRARDKAERMIFVALAGQVAEMKFANRNNWVGSKSDWHTAINLGSYFVEGNEKLERAYYKYLWECGKTIFNRPWLWEAVEAVVKELLIRKKMGRRLTRKIIKEAIDNYRSREKGR